MLVNPRPGRKSFSDVTKTVQLLVPLLNLVQKTTSNPNKQLSVQFVKTVEKFVKSKTICLHVILIITHSKFKIFILL